MQAGHLLVESGWDGAACIASAAYQQGHLIVVLQPDTPSMTPLRQSWFHFRVKGVKAGELLQVRVLPFGAQHGLIKAGYRTVWRRTGRPQWTPALLPPQLEKVMAGGTGPVSSSGAAAAACGLPLPADHYALTFRHRADVAEPLEFALVPPHPYTLAVEFADALAKRQVPLPPGVGLGVGTLCHSVCGRPAPVIAVWGGTTSAPALVEDWRPAAAPAATGLPEDPLALVKETILPRLLASLPPKRPVLLVTGRQHPGETPGSFMLEGLLQLALGPGSASWWDAAHERFYDAGAEPPAVPAPSVPAPALGEVQAALLSSFSLVIIPHLNPDGVAQGNYRMDVPPAPSASPALPSPLPVNLNREWGDPHPRRFPTLASTKALVQGLMNAGHVIGAYWDLHAHANRRGGFVFGNLDVEALLSPPPASSGGLASGSPRSPDFVDAVAFPRAMALHSGHLDPLQCAFTADDEDERDDKGDGKGDGLYGGDAEEDAAAAAASSSSRGSGGLAALSSQRRGTARSVLGHLTGAALTFTVECHYVSGKKVYAMPPPGAAAAPAGLVPAAAVGPQSRPGTASIPSASSAAPSRAGSLSPRAKSAGWSAAAASGGSGSTSPRPSTAPLKTPPASPARPLRLSPRAGAAVAPSTAGLAMLRLDPGPGAYGAPGSSNSNAPCSPLGSGFGLQVTGTRASLSASSGAKATGRPGSARATPHAPSSPSHAGAGASADAAGLVMLGTNSFTIDVGGSGGSGADPAAVEGVFVPDFGILPCVAAGQRPPTFGPSHWRVLGASLVHALLELHGSHPASRLGAGSPYANWEALRAAVTPQIECLAAAARRAVEAAGGSCSSGGGGAGGGDTAPRRRPISAGRLRRPSSAKPGAGGGAGKLG